jgi:hypothetical protein
MTKETNDQIQSYDQNPAAGGAIATIEGDQPERPGQQERASRYPITEAEYSGLQQAYEFMNATLFGGELPDLLITLQRQANCKGYFSANRFAWRDGDGAGCPHELGLNPDTFLGRTDEEIVSTLVHEQSHCWEAAHGTAPKRHYHNKTWAQKMIAIGLMPSSTGAVGGKITGVRMTHYILPDGPFAKAFAELAATGWKLNLQSAPALGREGGRASKTKFTCAKCGQNIWGKPDTAVACWACMARILSGDVMALEPFRMRASR